MRVTALMIIAGLLFALASPVLRADDAPILRVSGIVVPPLITRNKEDGSLGGSAITALRQEEKRCGITVEVIISPSWNRAFMMAQVGIVDGVIPTNFAKNRLAHFDFPPSPLVDMRPGLIVLADSPITTFTGLAMLEGKRIGVRTAALLEDRFDAYVRSGAATRVERPDTKALVDALLRDELDFIADSFAMVEYYFENNPTAQKVRRLDPPLGVSGQYLALSKKRSAPFAPGTEPSACLLGADAAIKP